MVIITMLNNLQHIDQVKYKSEGGGGPIALDPPLTMMLLTINFVLILKINGGCQEGFLPHSLPYIFKDISNVVQSQF